MKLTDLESGLQAFLAEIVKNKKVSVGLGSRSVILYVVGRQTQKQVESRIPEEYRAQIRVVLTSSIRPAHGTTASKDPKKA